jgi:hypothetical protein
MKIKPASYIQLINLNDNLYIYVFKTNPRVVTIITTKQQYIQSIKTHNKTCHDSSTSYMVTITFK